MDDALTPAPDLEFRDEKLTEPFSMKLAGGDVADLDRVVEWERKRAKPGYEVTRTSLVRAALRLYLNQRLKRIAD